MCVSVHSLMYSWFAEVGSKDEKWLFTPAAPQAWESCVWQERRCLLWQCLQQPVWSALLASQPVWRTGRSELPGRPRSPVELSNSPPKSHGAVSVTQMQWAGQLREMDMLCLTDCNPGKSKPRGSRRAGRKALYCGKQKMELLAFPSSARALADWCLLSVCDGSAGA